MKKRKSVAVSSACLVSGKPDEFVAKASAYISALGSVIPPVLGEYESE